jgi:hypothetical protein
MGNAVSNFSARLLSSMSLGVWILEAGVAA